MINWLLILNTLTQVGILACAVMAAFSKKLFSFYTGRGIFLDIALVTAIAGFISMVVIGRYLDRRL